ncbi:MAG: hypothetical protein JSW48_03185 [Betaproteobacteria bacterium]|nr:MAG: hypothetical protein JSW48_03185 [Betaproteobacteria bacterium]
MSPCATGRSFATGCFFATIAVCVCVRGVEDISEVTAFVCDLFIAVRAGVFFSVAGLTLLDVDGDRAALVGSIVSTVDN